MLAYTSGRQLAGTRSSSPNSMLLVAAAHIAAVAVLMSAKMGLPIRIAEKPLVIATIAPEPPESIDQPLPPRPAPNSTVTTADSLIRVPTDPLVVPKPQPYPPLPGPVEPLPGAGDSAGVARPIAATPAVLLTGATELKPPYPSAKLASGEEAVLKLRQGIDPSGRVTSVEPLGHADPAFLSAARRHILAHWRYRPATSAGHGVATSFVINLRFQLDD